MITHQPPPHRWPDYATRLDSAERDGTCIYCGRPRCEGRAALRACYACAARRRERRRAERYADAVVGACPDCRLPRADWNGGLELRRCPACTARHNTARRARRCRQRQAGVCRDCGAPSGDRARCLDCRIRERRAQRERRSTCRDSMTPATVS